MAPKRVNDDGFLAYAGQTKRREALDAGNMRKLTGLMALRSWVVVIVCALVAGLFLITRLPTFLGATMVTIAGLALPIAIVMSICWVLRLPATAIPRILLWMGVIMLVGGIVSLIIWQGTAWLMVTATLGVWLLLVGVVATLLVS